VYTIIIITIYRRISQPIHTVRVGSLTTANFNLMTLTYEFYLDGVNMNHLAGYLVRKLSGMSRLPEFFFAGGSEVSDYSLDGKQQQQKKNSKNRHSVGD